MGRNDLIAAAVFLATFGVLVACASTDDVVDTVDASDKPDAAVRADANQPIADASSPTDALTPIDATPPGTCVSDASLQGGPPVPTYLKPSNPYFDPLDVGFSFGNTVVLSTDGTTAIVGAIYESSDATGINGSQTDHSALSAGAVYIFSNEDGGWTQSAYVKASNTTPFPDDDELPPCGLFGGTIALSADGNTMAVGSASECGISTGINGDQTQRQNSSNFGAVYVFVNVDGTWSQQAYVKASNPTQAFGQAVVLSADGNTMAIGTRFDQGTGTGVNGDASVNPDLNDLGAVYTYSRAGSTWTQDAYIKPDVLQPDGEFGVSLAISADGNTLVVGACGNVYNYTDGATFLFSRVGGAWSQTQKLTSPKPVDGFGSGVALSAAGDTLAISAPTTGETLNDAGQPNLTGRTIVYVYGFAAGTYALASSFKVGDQDYIQNAGDFNAISMSADGNLLVLGSPNDRSGSTNINGDFCDQSQLYSGAGYVFERTNASWSLRDYVKASNTRASALFGFAAALSGDGMTLLVGSPYESSGAAGVNGNQANTTSPETGAAYIYDFH